VQQEASNHQIQHKAPEPNQPGIVNIRGKNGSENGVNDVIQKIKDMLI
jgi:hypothetical protein